MAQKRLSMRKIRDVLRLKHELGRSQREIGVILWISHSTVGSYVRRAREAGVTWPLPDDLDDAGLETALYPPTAPSRVPRPEPNWARVHRELARPQGCDASASVAGVPRRAPGRVWVQPVLRPLPRVARAPQRGMTPSLPGGREGLRGLRGLDGQSHGPADRTDPRSEGCSSGCWRRRTTPLSTSR